MVSVTCPAHFKCWISAVQPMYRDTGDITLTLGNTTWHLPGVYFDSPDPTGDGAYEVDEQPLTATEQATLPKGFTRQLGSGRNFYRMPSRSQIAKPTLHLALSGPRTVNPGSRVMFALGLTASHPEGRASYPVTHVNVRANRGTAPGHWLLGTLPAGRTRVLLLVEQVPRSAHGQFCISISAKAPHARSARARSCETVAAIQGRG